MTIEPISDISSKNLTGFKKACHAFDKDATNYTTSHGGKPWTYVLIPHDAVMINMSFAVLVERYAAP